MLKVKNDKIVQYYHANIRNHHKIVGCLTVEPIAESVAMSSAVEWAVF